MSRGPLGPRDRRAGQQERPHAGESERKGFDRVHPQHGLSIAVAGILLIWLMLYRQSDPDTHLGGFFGNAIADWLGTLVIVIATKYLHEIGSAESVRRTLARGPLARFSSITR